MEKRRGGKNPWKELKIDNRQKPAELIAGEIRWENEKRGDHRK